MALGLVLFGLAAAGSYVAGRSGSEAPHPVMRYTTTPTQNTRALEFYRRARNYEAHDTVQGLFIFNPISRKRTWRWPGTTIMDL